MKRALITLAILVSSLLCLTPRLALADPLGGICNGAGSASAVCQDKNNKTNPLTGSDGLILKVANIIAIFAGVAAVIIIILAGLRFVTSAGSSEDVAGARRTIIYASVGLVVIVVARALIGLVIGNL